MKTLKLDMHFAAAAALCAAGAANAAVVTWNCNLTIPANIDGLYINVETQQSGSAGSGVAGWDINPYGATALSFFSSTGGGYMRFPGATTGVAGNLNPNNGTVVGASGSWSTSTTAVTFGSAAGNWQLNAVNYFGFRFIGGDGQVRYGYGVMQVGANAATRTLLSVAYESTAGASIIVPAPGALALLGVAGLASRRRR
jgi:MYXO-CTERM domain-containing protein